jgi:uncharacterized protein
MEFEFDSRKSASNKDKHGIDFETAQAIWEDNNRLEIPALTVDEPRKLIIGKIGEKLWSAVITTRNEKTRIISVRRARREEKELYES